MTLDIRENEESEVVVVELCGELDSSSVAVFTLKFREITGKRASKKYVLDMKGLEFISSAGWTAFLNECKELRAAGGDLKIAAMQADAKRVYGLVGIDSVIESHEAVKDAVKSYAKNG
ncbi:MAG TPA: anti-sigma factor antagonist [bacterium]|nr:anti-sigma factor antagonist [bacterium]